jgi:hypothetical protein
MRVDRCTVAFLIVFLRGFPMERLIQIPILPLGSIEKCIDGGTLFKGSGLLRLLDGSVSDESIEKQALIAVHGFCDGRRMSFVYQAGQLSEFFRSVSSGKIENPIDRFPLDRGDIQSFIVQQRSLQPAGLSVSMAIFDAAAVSGRIEDSQTERQETSGSEVSDSGESPSLTNRLSSHLLRNLKLHRSMSSSASSKIICEDKDGVPRTSSRDCENGSPSCSGSSLATTEKMSSQELLQRAKTFVIAEDDPV